MATKTKRRAGYLANDPPEHVNRVRFNHGYHDAALAVRIGKPRTLVLSGEQSPTQVSRAFSRFYYQGYAFGLMHAREGAYRETSEPAWLQFVATLGEDAGRIVGTYEEA